MASQEAWAYQTVNNAQEHRCRLITDRDIMNNAQPEIAGSINNRVTENISQSRILSCHELGSRIWVGWCASSACAISRMCGRRLCLFSDVASVSKRRSNCCCPTMWNTKLATGRPIAPPRDREVYSRDVAEACMLTAVESSILTRLAVARPPNPNPHKNMKTNWYVRA